MAGVRPRAAIVGIGQTEFSKHLGVSEAEVACIAVKAALDDAGLAPRDVDGLCLYDIESNTVADVVTLLGLRDVRFFSTHSHGGGSYCAVVTSAAAAITAGHARTVLAFRARNRGRQSGFGKGMMDGGRPWEKVAPRIEGMYQWQVPFGVAAPAHEMALIARRHMIDYGTTEDHFGEVACAIRSHAVRNPNAIMRDPMTLEDHHHSRFVAEPLRLFDCCIETDGGAAIVLTSQERARDARRQPAYVLASAQCLGPAHHHPHDWFAFDRRRWMTAAAARLWGTAGVRPDDVDAAMLYDHFTPMVLLALEDWGFCDEGESGAFVEGGTLRGPDGRLPVNTHGGQLSEAFIHGFNNWNEAVRQLRGTSTCQVPGAELVLVAAASSDPYGAVLLSRS
ncbi:MAG: thiolase C-terminal domain-containing protein [Candidatus Binatia bacterium]